MAERQTRPVLSCRTCGYKLYRCMECGSIGCRHPSGWEVCPAQMFREHYCKVCGKRTKTKMVRGVMPRELLARKAAS